MANISFEEFLQARGLTDNQEIESAYRKALYTLPLAAMRDAAGLKQKEMAALLGKSQASISKFEGRGDFLLSTLFEYIEALKGSIEVKVRVAEQEFSLSPARDESETFFQLVKDQKMEAIQKLFASAQSVDLKASRRSGTATEERSRSSQFWRPFGELRGYTKVQDLFNQCAANDETQPIAA